MKLETGNLKLGVLRFAYCVLMLVGLSASAREITGDKWKVETGPSDRMDLELFQGESVEYTQPLKDGRDVYTLDTNTVYTWEIRGWEDYTNIYAVTTGTVASVDDGELSFELTGAQANIADGTYLGYIRSVTTNDVRSVLCWQRIKVEWSEWSTLYDLVEALPNPYYTQGEVAAISNVLASATSEVSGQISEVSGQVSEVSGQISEVSGQVLDVSNRVDAAEADMSAVIGNISNSYVVVSGSDAVASGSAGTYTFNGYLVGGVDLGDYVYYKRDSGGDVYTKYGQWWVKAGTSPYPTNAIYGDLPPYDGWKTNDVATDVNVEWFSGQDAALLDEFQTLETTVAGITNDVQTLETAAETVADTLAGANVAILAEDRAALGGASTNGAALNNPFVVVIYGQSQVANNSGEDLPYEGEGSVRNAYRYYLSSGSTTVKTITWDGSDTSWVSLPIADYLRGIVPADRTLIFVEMNYGGQPIEVLMPDYATGRWSEGGINTYEALIDVYDDMLSMTGLSNLTANAFIWNQGESIGSTYTTAELYAAAEMSLADSLRADCNNSTNALWITCGIGPGYETAQFGDEHMTDIAKRSLVVAGDPLARYVYCRDLLVQDWDTNMHYDPASFVEMGRRCVDAMFADAPHARSFDSLTVRNLTVTDSLNQTRTMVSQEDCLFYYDFENPVAYDRFGNTELVGITNGTWYMDTIHASQTEGSLMGGRVTTTYNSSGCVTVSCTTSQVFSAAMYIKPNQWDTANDTLLSNNGTSGFWLYHSSTKNIALTADGTAISYSIASAPNHNPVFVGLRHEMSGTDGLWTVNVGDYQKTYTNSSETASLTDTLGVFGRADGTYPTSLSCADLIYYDRLLTDTEMDTIKRAFINRETAVFGAK
jgi:hypothetical protein